MMGLVKKKLYKTINREGKMLDMENKSENKINEINENKEINEKKQDKKKTSRKVKNIIEYIIIFLVILVNAVMIYKSTNNPNKTPSLFGKKAFVIISGSMIPEIQIGDIVLIKDTTDVKVGDVIAFRMDSSVIVHRIIKEMTVNDNIMYQTKGDNNNAPDIDLVDVPSIEGLCIGKVPFIGNILIWLYHNLAIVVVIIVLILIIKYYLL